MHANLSSPFIALSFALLWLLSSCGPDPIDVAESGPIFYSFDETRTFTCDETYDYEGLLLSLNADTLVGCGDRFGQNSPGCQSARTDSLSFEGISLGPGTVLKVDLTQLDGYDEVGFRIGNYCGEWECNAIGFFDRRGNQLQTEPLRRQEQVYTLSDLPEDLAYFLVPGCEIFVRSVRVR